MMSADNPVAVGAFNLRMDKIELQLENIEVQFGDVKTRLGDISKRLDGVDNTLTAIGYELKYHAVGTAHLQTSVYWGFAVIAVVVALVGFVITLAPMFREMYKDKHAARLTEERVQEMIDTAVAKALASRT